jgi:hypothetical protein
MECVSVKKMVEGGLSDLTGITHIVVVLYKFLAEDTSFLIGYAYFLTKSSPEFAKRMPHHPIFILPQLTNRRILKFTHYPLYNTSSGAI